MLVLTRKMGEDIVIGDGITVKVLESGDNRVKIGIEAPDRIGITRGEIFSDELSFDFESRELDLSQHRDN